MQVRHLRIERFRAIQSLTWSIADSFVALVGPGDATKSTILDAIELALSPRWNPPIEDTDFYRRDTKTPFTIEVTVGRLPDRLLRKDKFGLETRGWTPAGGLVDEPAQEHEVVLTVRLRVDSSLEPKWTIVNNRVPDGRPIGAADREALGVARIGHNVDRHLSWTRGAVLARLTENPERLGEVLAEAARAARTSLPDGRLPGLDQTAEKAEAIGKKYGVGAKTKFRPALDMGSTAVSAGSIALHDGEVPFRRAGLGTRRLLATALQHESTTEGGITLVDEFEHGLEPHRIRALLRALRQSSSQEKAAGPLGQVFLTTHSPIVAEELGPSAVKVVRHEAGVTTVRDVPTDLRPTLITHGHALLGRKVLVCEGKTELGFARVFDKAWSEAGTFFALHGVAIVFGEGSTATLAAARFRELGYDVALFGDSDVPTQPTVSDLDAAGVKVVVWADEMSIEKRLATDLPWNGVVAMVRLAFSLHGTNVILDKISAALGTTATALGDDPTTWTNSFPELKLRTEIGELAMHHKIHKSLGGWFKRVDLAEELATVVLEHLPSIAASDLAVKIRILQEWIAS